VKGANVLYLEYLLEAVSIVQIVEWASRILVSNDPIANSSEIISLAELKGIDSDEWKMQPENLLKQVVQRYYADFNIGSLETEIYARACLREKCSEFLVGVLLQSEFFAILQNIYRLFHNPSWLGQLYVLSLQSSFCTNQEIFDRSLIKEVKMRLTEL
jgi:hypothetical protein